jgi:hypothetical protein
MPTLPPRAARVGAAYIFGADGTNVCPANSAKIMDMPTCVAAAASVWETSVTPWASASVTPWQSASSPSGCFSYYPSCCYNSYSPDCCKERGAYLNTHATGAAEDGSTPLCAGAHPGLLPAHPSRGPVGSPAWRSSMPRRSATCVLPGGCARRQQ